MKLDLTLDRYIYLGMESLRVLDILELERRVEGRKPVSIEKTVWETELVAVMKTALAMDIVGLVHSPEDAEAARLKTVAVNSASFEKKHESYFFMEAARFQEGYDLKQLLVDGGYASSVKEARMMILSDAVRVSGLKGASVCDAYLKLSPDTVALPFVLWFGILPGRSRAAMCDCRSE